ncbi:BspA family leucine-rich repeat surface protein [Ruminococcus albus]|uniref:Surface protein n=1 Tax=Ruminococcus albus TaxID=1264 RepID=A0A1I1RF88_RUMAL|nr:BspA family leucine-rich repeat surface protein [Ruminococcus albus]SFD32965.1 surface protein [Ruminococcus albus]
MQGKRFLAIVLSLCMLSGTVSNSAPVITHSITAQAANASGDCYSFNAATGVLTLKGKVDGDILRESELQVYLAQNVKSVVAASGTVLPEDSSRLFYQYVNCTSIDLSKADTSKVKDMNCMFYGCTNLTSLDISRFDTSSVTNMACMFCCCSGLTSLDVSRFKTSNVTNMTCMFWGCSSLKTLGLSGFNTSKVTTFDSMFYGCCSLTKLDLSSFDTSKVTTMKNMFGYCGRIKNLALGKNFKNIATEASLPNGNGWVNVNDPKTVVSGSESYANIENGGNNIYRNPIACIKGDVNVDGVVNSDDRDLLQKWLVNMVSNNELDLENADVNYDGKVDIMDLVELSRLCKQNTNSESGSSDGNTSAEEKTTEHIDAGSEVLSKINTDDNAFEVSLDITASGNAISSLNVDESGYSGVIESDMVVGVVPEFECEEGAVIDNVTLNFDIKDDFTDNTNGKYAEVSDAFDGINRLNVFKYYDDIGMLLPVETTCENNRVTAEVDGLGTYCLVDMEQWFENLGIAPEELQTVNTSPSPVGMLGVPISATALTGAKNTYNTPIDVVFHAYAKGTDNQNKIEDAIMDTATSLFNEYGRNGNVRIYVANYSGTLGVTDQKIKYAENEEELQEILDRILPVASSISASSLKYQTHLSSLMTNYSNCMRENADRYYVFVEKTAINVNATEGVITDLLDQNNMTAVMISSDPYATVTKNTGGIRIKSKYDFGEETSNFIIGKHGKNPNEFLTVLPNNWKKIHLNEDSITNDYIVYYNKHNGDDSQFNFSDYPDFDGDGLIDLQELDYRQIEWNSNGHAILRTIPEMEEYYKKDMTALKKSFIKYGAVDWNMFDKIKLLPVISDPTEKDSDDDGFTDDRDANPLEQPPYFDMLKEVDDFDNDSLIKEMRKELDEGFLNDQAKVVSYATADYYPADIDKKTLNELYGYVDFPDDILNDLKSERKQAKAEFATLPQGGVFGEAASAMDWFLDNTGKDRELSSLEIRSFLLTNSGSYRYQVALSAVADYAKNVLKDGDAVILASKKACISFRALDGDVKIWNPLLMVNEANWFCTINNASGAVIAKVKRVGDTYTMEYTYNVIDYYDWDIDKNFTTLDIPVLKLLAINDCEFAKMHLAGIARSYFQHGKISGKCNFGIDTDPLVF